MTGPFHILRHEHRVIEKALRALSGVCSRLERGQHVREDALSALVNFLATFANRYHHGKEESCLFPTLERYGITRNGGPIGVMQSEHDIERALTSEMVRAVESYHGHDPASKARFIAAARGYIGHFLSHIASEDRVLFCIADELLDEPEKAALLESFKAADSRLAIHSPKEFERIADELEDRWAL